MNWHLKKADSETVYGPVDEKSLEAWAADGRISPFDMVSSDQKDWKPAPQVDALKMEWTVELDDGRRFGPLHVLAFRELVRAGELKPEAKARSSKTGQTDTVAAVLLPFLLGAAEKTEAGDEALSGQFEMARRAAGELAAMARQAESDLQHAREQLARAVQEKEAALRRAAQAEAAASAAGKVVEKTAHGEKEAEQDRAALERRVSDLQEQRARAEKESKAAAEKLAAAQDEVKKSAARASAELASAREEAEKALQEARQTRQESEQKAQQAASEIAALREQLAKARQEKAAPAAEPPRPQPAAAEKDLAEMRATIQRQALELQAAAAQLATARAEIEKWKKQFSQAQAGFAEAEKMRTAAKAQPAKPSDMVPREQLEEALRRIAHLERSYRQALSSMHRNLAARSGESQATPPEQLRRRDIA